MHAGEGFIVASGFDPGAFIDQIGGVGLTVIIVAVVVVLIVVKIVFSALRKVFAVVITLALIGALGGGFFGIATGALDHIPDIFDAIFDNMPWA